MKIICIGRNYIDHAKELNNPVPDKPVVFLKPDTAMLTQGKPFYHPQFSENIHYEAELVIKVAKNGRHIQKDFAKDYYKEVTVGIDFTARDIQSKCKEKGHPWEIAKGFDNSAVIGRFLSLDDIGNWEELEFSLDKNGKEVQKGFSKDMIFSMDDILVYVSQFFKLQMGDFIFTGTPAGVGKVEIGDQLVGRLGDQQVMTCEVK